MDTEGSDIDVTELDDCLRELEAIDISDLELSDNEQNLDAEKLPVKDESVSEDTGNKPPDISTEKNFVPSCELERKAKFEIEGTAKINYPGHCTELGENCDIGKSTGLPCPVEDKTEDSKPELAFQTNLSVTELRQILQTTIQKGILENKNKSEFPVELSDTTVVKDTVNLSHETREETKQLVSTLVQHISHVAPSLSPETTFTSKFSPNLESTPKRKCHKVIEEDNSCRLDDTAFKLQVGTILKKEVSDPVPEDTEAVLSENESPPVLKRALSEASLSSCETVIFERRSPVEQRLCRRPSSDIGDIEERQRPSSDIGDVEESQRPSSDIGDIEEVILVKSILQNLEALEACDSLEAISPDSMSSPPPVKSHDKAVSAELSENDIDYKKERRKKRRKKRKTKKRHDRKKKEDNEKDGLSDASSVSSDDFPEDEKKPSRPLDYLAHCPTKKKSPSHRTRDRRSPSGSPNRSLSFPRPRQLSSQISLRNSPHSSEPLRFKPRNLRYERKSKRDGSSSSPSPSRPRRSYKKPQSVVKTSSAAPSRSPTHSPPHRSLHSRYTKKRHEPLRSRSKSPKRRYRWRSRSRSFSPHSKKSSTTPRRKYRKSSRHSESPLRLPLDVRSNSPLERKISRRLKKLESLRNASRWRSKSRSLSPKIKQCFSKEIKTDFESLRDSKSPKNVTSTSLPEKSISESEKKLPSPTSSVSRQSSSPKRRISSPVAQQSSTCPTDNSSNTGPVGNSEKNSESLPKPSSSSSRSPEENTDVRINHSPEKKVLPADKSRTPSPPSANMKTSKPEPMDISPTPETKLLKETSHPVLNADFSKLPPVPSLVMQLPAVWSQPPPPGTLPVCDTHTLPPPPGTLPYGVQPLSSLPLQSQQQMHSSFGYSHPHVQCTYQSGSPAFGLPVYSSNNNQNNFHQQPLYGQNFATFPQVPSSSNNLVGPIQFQTTYDSPVTIQDMSVPPPVYNQSQKYQPNFIAQYPPQTGNHTAPYLMQNTQQVHNIMQNSQNIPQSQTQLKINGQQVLRSQNTNNQSLSRTSPFASCRDPRLKDINISPSSVPSAGTQLNNATTSKQSNASLAQKVLTDPQKPLPGQPPLPPGQPPPLPSGQPPPLPPGQPPLPPKEMKVEQPPLPKSPPPSTPSSNKMSKVQEDNPSTSSGTQAQQLSTNNSHLQSNLKKLLPNKDGGKQELESVTTTSGSEPSDSQTGNKEDIHECVCERTGFEKKICLRCLYRKREKLEQASVFSKTPNLCRSVKRPIVVNLLHKRKTQPVTAIVKPNVHEIQTSSSSSEQPCQQESVTTTFNLNSLHSETKSHDSTELVPIVAEQRTDKQYSDTLDDKSTVDVQKSSPGHQTNLMHPNTSSNPENSGIMKDVGIDSESGTHKQGTLVDGSEKVVSEDQTHNLETEHYTKEAVKNDEHTSEVKESLKDCVVLKQTDIDLNKVKSTCVQMNNGTSLKNKYLTYVITGNKANKKVLTSVISGNIGNKKNFFLRRTYRSKSADSMLDSLNQAAKECAKLPKDDLLHATGNCSLMFSSNVLENNTPLPLQNSEDNKAENNTLIQQIDQEKTNSTEMPISKYQTSFSEKVEESDTLNNREGNAASAIENSKETVLLAQTPNNNGNLQTASPKPNDIHLSAIKLDCASERHTEDILGPGISVKEEPLEIFESAISAKEEPLEIFESAISAKEEPQKSDAGDAERRSKMIGQICTKLNSTAGLDLESMCSVDKTKCHETQNPLIHLNSDVTASVKMTECNLNGSAGCSGEKVANTNIHYTSFKNENSDPSVSMQTERQSPHIDTSFKNENPDPSVGMETERQSLLIDTEHSTQDEKIGSPTNSTPVTPENEFKRPINKGSSCVEIEKVAITAESDARDLDILENVQQPTLSVTQKESPVKDKCGLLDNCTTKVGEGFPLTQSLHETSVCHTGEVMQKTPFKKVDVESEEEKDSRIKRSCPPTTFVNISVSDSSDSDIIELPTTIDLCLSDDADDMHEEPVSRKVLPIVDVTNDKPIVLSDSECITIDSSPKKEISQTNKESIDETPSKSSAPLIGSQENCVTDSILPIEQLEVPCLNSSLSKLPIQRNDKPVLQMEIEVSSDDSKQPSYDKRVEVMPTKPDISKNPPPSKPIISDMLLLQMKPAPRSVKLQHAAILQDKHVHEELLDINPAAGQNMSKQKIELDRQEALRDTETEDTSSFSEKNVKGSCLKNKRNFSVLSDSSNNENTYDVAAVSSYADGRGEINALSITHQEYGEPSLKKRKQSPLIKNDEQIESNQTFSIQDHPKRAQRSILSVTVLQPISIIPSESRVGTLSSQAQRLSSRILRSPQKNTVIFAKYMGSTGSNSEEEDCSNEDKTMEFEKLTNNSEKTIKKYPHRSQLPSYAISRRILISRLRRCPVVLQANLKKMAKLLRQDSKLTQIPIVVLEQIDLQSDQNKKIIQNLGLKRSVSRCSCCQVLCRNIATQTDSSHTN